MNNSKFIIGIDTGGTYTDAVLLGIEGKNLVASAKFPTTHHNLSLGISKCLGELFHHSGIRPADVEMIAVSTTLATNAVVEGKGADVALLVAGPAKHFNLPVVAVNFLRGGHNHLGEEAEKLDMETLVDSVRNLQGVVDSYAVCSAMSIINPAHELIMAKAIGLIDPKPVFCSHEVSDRPGIKERAATCVLNARLMPVMEDFLAGMQDSLVAVGMAGRVYIIRGDATPMEISQTHKQAASTVASGPAATAWFGLSFSPSPDALIVDVGGTTTDITVIKEGHPLLDNQGSLIGEWHTHVDAVQMSTVGAGGDSHAAVDRRGTLKVSSVRVTPLAMSDRIPPPEEWLGRGLADRCVAADPDITPEEAQHDKVLAFLVEHGPATPQKLKDHFDMAEITLVDHLKELNRLQLIVEAGFTPTDALHVLGRLELGSRDAALQGAQRLAAELEIGEEELCHRVLEAVEQKIEDAIVDHMLKIETGKTLSGFYPGYRKSTMLDLRFSSRLPIVGIGAAARYLLPNVAERLNTEVVFPAHYEVGNAFGAAMIGLAKA